MATINNIIRVVANLNDFQWNNFPDETSEFFIEKMKELGFSSVSCGMPWIFEKKPKYDTIQDIEDEVNLKISIGKYINLNS